MRTRLAPILSLLLALASCGPGRNQFAPACPVPGLVGPLSEIARYRGASHDVRDLVVRGRVVDIVGTCEPGDSDNAVLTRARIIVDATRGPAMAGDAIGLPVFIAVTDGDAIRDKTVFEMPVEFPRGVDTARATSKEVRMEIPVTPVKSGAAYGVIGGFQLTPEEVAAWRRDHHR